MTMKSSVDSIEDGIIRLETPEGASVRISLQGAQILSWVPAQGGERLYLSERARFQPDQPIRGGIPVIFPQFAHQGSGQRHGFARLRQWHLETQRQQENFAMATFRLEDDEATQAIWPHAFHAELTVMLEGNRLDVELEVVNRDQTPFEFTAALHSYLRLGNVELARLEGLEGLYYLDAMAENARRQDTRHAVLIDDETDRLYLAVEKPLLLSETGRQLAIEQSGFRNVVVWNPWETGIGRLSDMAPLDFKRMLCVEAVMAEPPVRLVPGEDWSGRQTLLAL